MKTSRLYTDADKEKFRACYNELKNNYSIEDFKLIARKIIEERPYAIQQYNIIKLIAPDSAIISKWSNNIYKYTMNTLMSAKKYNVKLYISLHNSYTYINATYIPGYFSATEYIATCAPTKETIMDFLDMVFLKKIKTVVSLNLLKPCDENDKSHMLLPVKEETFTYGMYKLEATLLVDCNHYSSYRISVKNWIETRSFDLFMYKGWTKKLAVTYLEFYDFRRNVREWQKHFSKPMVVFCQTGRSKTCTFICYDYNLCRIESGENIIFTTSFLMKIRWRRPQILFKLESFVLLHKLLLNVIKRTEKTIDIHELKSFLSVKGNYIEHKVSMHFAKYRHSNLKSLLKKSNEQNIKSNLINSSVAPNTINAIQIRYSDSLSFICTRLPAMTDANLIWWLLQTFSPVVILSIGSDVILRILNSFTRKDKKNRIKIVYQSEYCVGKVTISDISIYNERQKLDFKHLLIHLNDKHLSLHDSVCLKYLTRKIYDQLALDRRMRANAFIHCNNQMNPGPLIMNAIATAVELRKRPYQIHLGKSIGQTREYLPISMPAEKDFMFYLKLLRRIM